MTKKQYIDLRSTLDFSYDHSWLPGHVATDLFLMGLPGIWIYYRGDLLKFGGLDLLVSFLAALSLAVFYFRAFAMMHEAVHGTISSKRKWNDLSGLVYGVFCFLPFSHWREIHLLHHQWAGNVEKDPVMRLVLEFRKPPTATRRFMSVLWRSWFPILAILQTYVFWFVCVTRYRWDGGISRFLSLVLPLVVWGAVFAISGVKPAVFVLIPSILMYLAIVEVINFPHHMNLPQFEGETKLALWEQYKIARSCIYSRALSHLILLNFNYHSEHHLFPTLPWYRLEPLSERLRVEVPDYNFTMGNAWILENRGKSLEEVSRAPAMEDKAA